VLLLRYIILTAGKLWFIGSFFLFQFLGFSLFKVILKRVCLKFHNFERTIICSMPLTHFIEYLQLEKKYSVHTITAYRQDLISFQDFILKEFEEKELEQVNYSQVRSWIVNLVDSGVSNSSINRKIS